ncbi:hypothetical protein [Enterobacter chuandaensis]|uniref:Uncharacterized protein n=1 Tax=Enterobacter chuandaensis TaxID=2497875 RepID=A0AA96LYK8_9ENTR|nr:hypothetical protein [Enterobacter chuandaensis]MCW4780833.1 hypothetical protein [Enterobacter chuandaensis]MDA4758681.1 hypothetical protein [Enterobacter chuandaensis]WNS36107.1 hypothetical protein RQP59_13450 [Enterobacter chuandaensis]
MTKSGFKITSFIAPTIQFILALATFILSVTFSLEQNRISKLQYSPLFILSINQLFGKDYTPTQSEKFDIFNEGYSINNYNYKLHSIMNVAYTLNNKSYEKKFYVDYFSVQSKKSGGKDRMSGGIGENNILLFRKLKKQIIKNLNDKDINLINIELHHYSEISYSDTELKGNYVYFADSERVTKDIYENYLAGIDGYYTISLHSPSIDEIISRTLRDN